MTGARLSYELKGPIKKEISGLKRPPRAIYCVGAKRPPHLILLA